MARKIISIDENLCNGCGECVVGCSEGALQIINGKAKLVKEDFCDGFGDCVGTCPTGALKIIEREAKPFDEKATKQNLYQTKGKEAVWRMMDAQKKHVKQGGQCHEHSHSHHGGGCPGSRQVDLKANNVKQTATSSSNQGHVIQSDLEQWPVQLHLVNPKSSFFNEKEMVILSTCVPVASADIHWRYLRGRSVVVACPKLDITDPYVDKLAEIFQNLTIYRAIVVRMEVPCCGGIAVFAKQALIRSKRKDLIVEEHVYSLQGDLINQRTLTV